MSHLSDQPLQALQFYTTGSYPCGYLEGQQARSLVAGPSHLIDGKAYSTLIQQGFRRSGLFTYKPQCEHCQACRPIRIDAKHFQANRTQQKIWRKHNHLQTQRAPLIYNREHFALYRRYMTARHKGGDMDVDSAAQYSKFLLKSRVDTNLIEFRNEEGLLQIVSIIDIIDDGLSAVYTFFDPDTAGSLGTYAILWQLERCQIMQLPWLYLGYWIEESRKMAYKIRYKPYQILVNGVWTAIKP